jgi:hypothetical protein
MDIYPRAWRRRFYGSAGCSSLCFIARDKNNMCTLPRQFDG